MSMWKINDKNNNVRSQAIIWTNAGLLLIEPLGIQPHGLSFKKKNLKISIWWRHNRPQHGTHIRFVKMSFHWIYSMVFDQHWLRWWLDAKYNMSANHLNQLWHSPLTRVNVTRPAQTVSYTAVNHANTVLITLWMFICMLILTIYATICVPLEFTLEMGTHFESIHNRVLRIVLTHWGRDKMAAIFQISLKFVPTGPINNIPALARIMAWRRPGDKPLSESIMVNLLTHS